MKNIFKTKYWKFSTIVFLIAGLVVGVYLVQTKQIFKSRAMYDIERYPSNPRLHEAFDLTDENGNPLRCNEENGNYTCYSKTRNVKINLNSEKLSTIIE